MSSKKAEAENHTESAAKIDSQIDRALKQPMAVTYRGQGLFEVASGSGTRYDVDIEELNCTCRDAADGNVCKYH